MTVWTCGILSFAVQCSIWVMYKLDGRICRYCFDDVVENLTHASKNGVRRPLRPTRVEGKDTPATPHNFLLFNELVANIFKQFVQYSGVWQHRFEEELECHQRNASQAA